VCDTARSHNIISQLRKNPKLPALFGNPPIGPTSPPRAEREDTPPSRATHNGGGGRQPEAQRNDQAVGPESLADPKPQARPDCDAVVSEYTPFGKHRAVSVVTRARTESASVRAAECGMSVASTAAKILPAMTRSAHRRFPPPPQSWPAAPQRVSQIGLQPSRHGLRKGGQCGC